MAPLSCFQSQMPDARKLLLALAGAAAARGAERRAGRARPRRPPPPQAAPSAPRVGRDAPGAASPPAPRASAVFKGSMPGIARSTAAWRCASTSTRAPPTAPDWTEVDVDGFGEWDLSDPGVSGFIIKKRVSGLQGGVSYRAVVRFRWRNDAGRIVKTGAQGHRPCVQPDTAPDLVVREPSIVAGAARRRRRLPGDRHQHRRRGRRARSTSCSPSTASSQPAQRIGPLVPGASDAGHLPGAALRGRHDRALHRRREGRDRRVQRDEQRARAPLRGRQVSLAAR